MVMGAILFSVLALKTHDLLFCFFAVYVSGLAISFLFFKHEQKQNSGRKDHNSPLTQNNSQDK
jgi:hypothetical protein